MGSSVPTTKILRNLCGQDEGYWIIDKYVFMLIDTGPNITILSTKLWNSWNPSSRPEI